MDIVTTMIRSLLACLLVSGSAAAVNDQQPPSAAEKAEPVTIEQLSRNPGAYNHKLIEITAFVSKGFEDFSLFDPAIGRRFDVWLEYGGTVGTKTMYLGGGTPSAVRAKPLIVEGVSTTLLDDETFRRFNGLAQRRFGSTVHATLVGRFFSGKEVKYPNGTGWGGYGHFGCCSLLVIQQVTAVDPHDRNDVDYELALDQPQLSKAGCSSQNFLEEFTQDHLKEQTAAESGARAWAFDDPQRVAVDALARVLKVSPQTITGVKVTRQAQGRVVYEWRPKTQREGYMMVVTRPYWLTFYAKNPQKLAWIGGQVYQWSCPR